MSILVLSMESSNDQNLFDMTSNNNFDFNTTPMVMDQSYDMGMQQVGNVMGTNWSMSWRMALFPLLR